MHVQAVQLLICQLRPAALDEVEGHIGPTCVLQLLTSKSPFSSQF